MGYLRLSSQDTSFLHIEDTGYPMHTGGLLVMEGAPFRDAEGRFRLDEVRRRVESRLHLVPLMRKRLMKVRFEQGRPVWVDDQSFDIGFHVRHTALPRPGSHQQLLALCGRLQAQQLDRRRALWELWFVEGLDEDRVAIVMKTHHCMVDGVSSVDLLTTLVDLERDVPDAAAPPWQPEPPPEPNRLLVESLTERWTEPVELVRSIRAALRLPQVGRLLSSALRSAPETPWNVPTGPHRRWITAPVPLAEVKAVKNSTGATVNDVVLAACAGALRSFLERRGEPTDDRVLRAAVPVSVRSEGEQFGNRVSVVLVELPVGEPDVVHRLQQVHEQMDEIKESNLAVGAEALVTVQEYLAPTLVAQASRLLARSSPYNINITNVPGPQFPLYCMGAEVLELFPYVGLAPGQALSVAVVSYNGTLGFGVTCDPEVLPDLDELVDDLGAAFDELLGATR